MHTSCRHNLFAPLSRCTPLALAPATRHWKRLQTPMRSIEACDRRRAELINLVSELNKICNVFTLRQKASIDKPDEGRCDAANSKQKLEAKPFCGLTTHTHTYTRVNILGIYHIEKLEKIRKYVLTALINQATQLLTCQMNELAHKLQQNNNIENRPNPRPTLPLFYSLPAPRFGSQGNMSNGSNWKINFMTSCASFRCD